MGIMKEAVREMHSRKENRRKTKKLPLTDQQWVSRRKQYKGDAFGKGEEKEDKEATHTIIQRTDLVEDTYQLFDEIPPTRILVSLMVKQFQECYGLYQNVANLFDERLDSKLELRHAHLRKEILRKAENFGWEEPHSCSVCVVPSENKLEASISMVSSLLS
jgi:sulfur relay (sulfurtransferase) DsrC/TusE family protein